ncbi:hypothetical protein [Nonomuraea sp. MG754425]|uniref:hypothetical protein n=1 Tax=Nonomuraea sp. MG754425 TaxID=2570319 RepID=UPI001F1EE2C6|nr:hypothetical protein [Nonomuraea sp. MG754425]
MVSVSSNPHRRSPVVFDDTHFTRRPYEPWSAYDLTAASGCPRPLNSCTVSNTFV